MAGTNSGDSNAACSRFFPANRPRTIAIAAPNAMGVEMHVAVAASHALLMALVTNTGWDNAYPYQRNDHVEGGIPEFRAR